MNDLLLSLVYERLEQDGSANEPWSTLVMEACEGEEALERSLDSATARTAPPKPQAELQNPPAAFLGSVSVHGFRGIGKPVTLEIPAGPGLTVVVGRNGSGKSSFAEGLELLLTGANKRWEGRPKAWQDGWKNLHSSDGGSISAELDVEQQGLTSVQRRWGPDDELHDAQTSVQPHGKPKTTLDALGWSQAVSTYRPFLSYNELGSMLDEGPSKLYDALSMVLGLDDLVDAETVLSKARKSRDAALKEGRRAAKALQTRIDDAQSERPDSRLERCQSLLGKRAWDLNALEELLDGTATSTQDADVELLRRCALLSVPGLSDADAVARSLDTALEARSEFSGTEAERAAELAELLATAIGYHEKHTEADCPVCGTESVLGGDWNRRTSAEIERLRNLASACEQAEEGLRTSVGAARKLLQPVPSLLQDVEHLGIGPEHLLSAWTEWVGGLELEDTSLAAHIKELAEPLNTALGSFVTAATEALQAREDAWKPFARELVAWLPLAESALGGAEQVPSIKQAQDWLKTASEAIRTERFAPIADATKAIWATLRHQSNVNLEDIVLTGTRTKRRVELEVTVDDVEGAALGVMSQGELHALALSLFLPRAMRPESPFRFVVIDDPVQSMDPARVGGLARVLSEAAESRQIVVFTHDGRLPDAIRRMGIEATVVEVTRKPGSIVECRPARTPVQAYLNDAMSLAKDEALAAEVKSRVISGFCRSALEALFVDAVYGRRLQEGHSDAYVEKELESAKTLNSRAALALFGASDRAGDVMNRLKQFGDWAGTTYQQCNKGAHGTHEGDLVDLVKRSENLIERLQRVM